MSCVLTRRMVLVTNAAAMYALALRSDRYAKSLAFRRALATCIIVVVAYLDAGTHQLGHLLDIGAVQHGMLARLTMCTLMLAATLYCWHWALANVPVKAHCRTGGCMRTRRR